LCFVVPFMLIVNGVAVPGVLDRAVRADDAEMGIVLSFEAKPTPTAEARGVRPGTDCSSDCCG